MRVIGGSAGGLRLQSVPGRGVRPLPDRAKGSVFAVLERRIAGARFLDLYSGSGAVGIEALSRGAAHCVFVEGRAQHAAVIRENLARTGLSARGEVIRGDVRGVLAGLGRRGDRFDVVFVDPPYGKGLIEPTLAGLVRHRLLAAGAWVLAHHHHKESVPERVAASEEESGQEPSGCELVRFRELRFGEARVPFFQAVFTTPGGPST